MGLSQEAAGKKVGVTQATWCDWELGKKVPQLENAICIEEITDGDCPVAMFSRSGEAA
jgi:DNA-binding XRE family transcriptional regulator